MNYKMFAGTDIGNGRSKNEDCYGFDETGGIAVVADGMGGHNAGEVASRIAVDTFIEIARGWKDEASHCSTTDRVCDALAASHGAIIEEGDKDLSRRGMGTTIVVAILNEGRITVGHVGDSRCYRYRDGTLEPLTEDHNMAASIRRRNPDAYVPYDAHHSLERALGGRGPGESESDVSEFKVAEGDVFLLCTDGLCGYVSDDVVCRILTQQVDEPEECIRSMIKACYDEADAPDNITVLLAVPTG